MRATREELPVLLEAGASSIRGADWGEMRVALVSVPAGTDFGPLVQGLPGDACPSDHWGYVLKGRLRIEYPGSTEVFEGGDFYHMTPGHRGFAEEDTDFIEVGPPGPHQQFIETARSNLIAMAGEASP